jgi:protein-arginine kinase activator protein McsA
VTFSLPEFNLKKPMHSSWEFDVDDCSESSSTYHWETDNILIKSRDTVLYHQLGVGQKLVSYQVPLTSLTSSKVKIEWYSSCQQAFENIKQIIGNGVLLCYPDFNEVLFHHYTDKSDHQRLQ